MLRRFGQLLFQGGISVGICAIAALSISGLLSLIATSLQPKAVTESIANRGCRPGHCSAKPRPHVVAIRAQ